MIYYKHLTLKIIHGKSFISRALILNPLSHTCIIHIYDTERGREKRGKEERETEKKDIDKEGKKGRKEKT